MIDTSQVFKHSETGKAVKLKKLAKEYLDLDIQPNKPQHDPVVDANGYLLVLPFVYFDKNLTSTKKLFRHMYFTFLPTFVIGRGDFCKTKIEATVEIKKYGKGQTNACLMP